MPFFNVHMFWIWKWKIYRTWWLTGVTNSKYMCLLSIIFQARGKEGLEQNFQGCRLSKEKIPGIARELIFCVGRWERRACPEMKRLLYQNCPWKKEDLHWKLSPRWATWSSLVSKSVSQMEWGFSSYQEEAIERVLVMFR